MRYLIRLVCVCALSIPSLVGCGEDGEAHCNTAGDCDDGNECTADSCDPATGSCSNAPLADGAMCEVGACQSGSCEAIASVFPCTEQGIRDAIAEGGGPHAFDCAGPTTITTEDQIVIDNDVILDGQDELEVNGNGKLRVFTVPANVTVELRRLTVSGGATNFAGGGILNRGTAIVVSCTVSGNMAEFSGGGIGNGDPDHEGNLTIIDSTISGNTAPLAGGVGNWRGSMTVMNTTVSGNTGGGLGNDYQGTATVTNTTVSRNTGGWGGGVDNFGLLTLVHTTVSDNFTDFAGVVRGIRDLSEDGVTLINSLVDGDCLGKITSNGYNIESPGDTCGFDLATDRVDVTSEELNLGPLADNGGPTQTHALGLMPESAAIDAIPEEECLDSNGNPLVADQRGQPRPETGGARCDVGAFELERGGP